MISIDSIKIAEIIVLTENIEQFNRTIVEIND